jgi:hypothetical protein
MKNILFLVFIIIIFNSCKKENTSFDNEKKGSITIEFDHIVGDAKLMFDLPQYKNISNENYAVTKLKYYVSNLKFTRNDGYVYVVPQDLSYFLIEEKGINPSIKMDIPEGEYINMEFMLGIDSFRNTMDIANRIGVLDISEEGADMYWSWNSGYIFFKLEGVYGIEQSNVTEPFSYHIGGFGGYETPTLNNIKIVSIDLSKRGNPIIKKSKSTNVHLFVDVAKVFDAQHNLSIATYPNVMFQDISVKIAENYAHMFTHDHTEN